jgi:hypothetical protein
MEAAGSSEPLVKYLHDYGVAACKTTAGTSRAMYAVSLNTASRHLALLPELQTEASDGVNTRHYRVLYYVTAAVDHIID